MDEVSGNTIVNLSNDTTLYAVWRKSTFKIIFNRNGGENTEYERYVEDGDVIGELPEPIRANYSFSGWYTDDNGGTKITSTTRVLNDMTLFAHWIDNG